MSQPKQEPESTHDSHSRPSLGGDLANMIRGFCMGTADVIPGVSGGTVALILGIYKRLVTAISRFDLRLMGLVRSGDLHSAARHVDLRFLASLGLGIALGIVLLGRLMNQLLLDENTRGPTLAAFFGMVLASTWIVARYVQVKGTAKLMKAAALAAMGALVAYGVTGLPVSQQELTLPYVFLCGMLGICAMILPGISGAYILLMLGAYIELTGILKSLPHVSSGDAVIVAVFACGCGLGLISFSKVLRWLLTHYQWGTMAVLSGVMLGALRCIWPFKELRADRQVSNHKFRLHDYENLWPASLDGNVLLCIALAVVAGGAVLAIDWLTIGRERQEPGMEKIQKR